MFFFDSLAYLTVRETAVVRSQHHYHLIDALQTDGNGEKKYSNMSRVEILACRCQFYFEIHWKEKKKHSER